MDLSKGKYWDQSWSPIRGCSHASPGCDHCWAERMAGRFSERLDSESPKPPFEGFATHSGWTGRVELIESELLKPLHWRKPRVVALNWMGDLFHESLPDDAIDRVFAVMALTPHLRYLVLTKRAKRMRELLEDSDYRQGEINRWASNLMLTEDMPDRDWPLDNVALGISCEDQERADERIPDLLATPAAMRFVSIEPLLGTVNLRRYLSSREIACRCGHTFQAWQADFCGGHIPAAVGRYNDADSDADLRQEQTLACPSCGICVCDLKDKWKRDGKVHGGAGRFAWQKGEWKSPRDWVIVGGESGPGERPMDVGWARSIVAQCKAAGTPVFVKQMGAWPIDESRWKCRFGDTNKEYNQQILLKLTSSKGADPSEWPADLRVRELPEMLR